MSRHQRSRARKRKRKSRSGKIRPGAILQAILMESLAVFAILALFFGARSEGREPSGRTTVPHHEFNLLHEFLAQGF